MALHFLDRWREHYDHSGTVLCSVERKSIASAFEAADLFPLYLRRAGKAPRGQARSDLNHSDYPNSYPIRIIDKMIYPCGSKSILKPQNRKPLDA